MGVKIKRMRWLSKPSDKSHESVVVFLADHQEAETLLAKGMMDFRRNGVHQAIRTAAGTHATY